MMNCSAFVSSTVNSSLFAGNSRPARNLLRSRQLVRVAPRCGTATLPTLPGPGDRSHKTQTNINFDQVGEGDKGLTLKRLGRILRDGYRLTIPFLKEDVGARWHCLLVLFMTGMFTGVGLLWTMGYGALMTAMSEKSGKAIIQAIVKLACLLAFIVPTSVFNSYVSSRFRIRWTRYMTERLLGLYFSAQNYYKINTDVTQIDNPDEVIYEQISTFTHNAFYLVTDNIRTIFDGFAYSWLLFRLSPPLFGLTIAICVVSTLLINRIGRRLFSLEALNIRLSANFRFALARVRIYAESIAFYGGEKREEEVNRLTYNSARECEVKIAKMYRWTSAFERTFSYLPVMIPFAFLTPSYLGGVMTLGEITQASDSFQTLSSSFAFFVERYDWLVYAGASLERLTRFVDYVNREVKPELRAFSPPVLANSSTSPLDVYGVHSSEITTTENSSGGGLRLTDLTLRTPGSGRRVLVRDVNLKLLGGERMLIIGPSGVGKTSLLRAIAGLWKTGSGKISRQNKSDAFFMPQRPYCVLGTLREQLTYPHNEEHSDKALVEALTKVGLGHLASRNGGLDAVENWSDLLSVGETQRVAFARLALSSAKLVIIDEGTSALDAAAEADAMSIVDRPGRIVVSVGHRPSLLQFHDWVLALEPDAKWSLQKAAEYVSPTLE